MATYDLNLREYELITHNLADDIIIPYDALCCRNSNCTLHNNDIDGFYNAIHKSTQTVFLPLC